MKTLLIFFSLLVYNAFPVQDVGYESGTVSPSGQISVCHNGNIIQVNSNAIPAHQAHGDAVDLDGDGYFDKESSCSTEIDCDDNDAAITECESNSGFQLIPGIYIYPLEGTYTWNAAKNACENLVTPDGVDTWQLIRTSQYYYFSCPQNQSLINNGDYWMRFFNSSTGMAQVSGNYGTTPYYKDPNNSYQCLCSRP